MAPRHTQVPKTPAGQQLLTEWWDRAHQEFTTPTQLHTLETELGTTTALSMGEPGDHPTVLLYPGTNFCAVCYRELAEALAVHTQVVVADLVGQPGRTVTERPPFSEREAYQGWTREILEQLPLDRVVVGGHSLGGSVALMTAVGNPEHVAGVVLLNNAGLMKLKVPAYSLIPSMAWMLLPSEARSERLLQLMSEPGHEIDAATIEWMTLVARHVRSSLAPPPLPDEVLAQVKVPVLLVAGERDLFLPGEALRAAARQRLPTLHDAIVVPGAGHSLPHDRPGVVAEAIQGFLQVSPVCR